MKPRTTTMTKTFTTLCLTMAAVLLTACGSDSGKFRIEGRLRNINQAQLLVYSTDGGLEGIDTIMLREGRFAYDIPMPAEATMVLVFPNFSEQPVFASPGETVKIKGDASHLREITILGTPDNKLMTQFRMDLNKLMPPDIPKAAEDFIRQHPESRVSVYVLWRFFASAENLNLKKASQLSALLLKAQPDNAWLKRLANGLKAMGNATDSKKLPQFQATDVNGKKVSGQQLKAEANVVSLWASWSAQSNDMQRRLNNLKHRYEGRLAIVSICIDGNPKECRRRVTERDSLQWPTICDGKMWQSPLLRTMGFCDVPENIIADKTGTIVARSLTPQKMEQQIEKMLKDDK